MLTRYSWTGRQQQNNERRCGSPFPISRSIGTIGGCIMETWAAPIIAAGYEGSPSDYPIHIAEYAADYLT